MAKFLPYGVYYRARDSAGGTIEDAGARTVETADARSRYGTEVFSH